MELEQGSNIQVWSVQRERAGGTFASWYSKLCLKLAQPLKSHWLKVFHQIFVSLMPTRYTERVPEQIPKLHRETLSGKPNKTKNKQKSKQKRITDTHDSQTYIQANTQTHEIKNKTHFFSN